MAGINDGYKVERRHCIARASRGRPLSSTRGRSAHWKPSCAAALKLTAMRMRSGRSNVSSASSKTSWLSSAAHRRLGGSCGKCNGPRKNQSAKRARKDGKIREWKEQQWPRIAREAKAEGRTLVFVDESGLSQKPARKSTWAPETQTPVLEFNFAWKKLSVIGGLTLKSIYFQLHESSIKSAEACGFIDHLRQHIGKPLMIVWDGLRAHWSKEVKAHIDALKGSVRLEQLPAYAPELNPIEYLWGYIKGNDLANVCAKDLVELNAAARKAIIRTRKIKSHLRAFWIQSELDLSVI